MGLIQQQWQHLTLLLFWLPLFVDIVCLQCRPFCLVKGSLGWDPLLTDHMGQPYIDLEPHIDLPHFGNQFPLTGLCQPCILIGWGYNQHLWEFWVRLWVSHLSLLSYQLKRPVKVFLFWKVSIVLAMCFILKMGVGTIRFYLGLAHQLDLIILSMWSWSWLH